MVLINKGISFQAGRHVLIGFTVERYENWNPADIISAMKKLGVNFIELNRRVFAELPAVLPQLKGMHSAFHLPIVDDDGWDFSCVDFQTQIDETIAILNRHHRDMGLQHIISHPSEAKFASKPIDSSEEMLFSALSRLQIPVYFENIANYSPQEFRAFYERAKAYLGDRCAGMCYDAAHFQVSGHDPVDQFHTFRDIIRCAHLSDCRGDEDAHLPFGAGGDMPIGRLLQAMQRSEYSGPITLEIRPPSSGELRAYIRSYMTLLRQLDPARYHQARLRLVLLRPLLSYLSR